MATQVSLNSGAVSSAGSLKLQTNGTTDAVTIDTAQNLGLGVTPSASGSFMRVLQVGDSGYMGNNSGTMRYGNNFYIDSGGTSRYIRSSSNAHLYAQDANAGHIWSIAPSGTAGNPITFTQAMTLGINGGWNVLSFNGVATTTGSIGIFGGNSGDNSLYLQTTDANIVFRRSGTEVGRFDSSGNLLVGTTSTLNYKIQTGAPSSAGYAYFNGDHIFYNCSTGGASATGTAYLVQKASTGRSINAAGTINASGADYAEYMTKAGDFTVAKGDVVGINAEGKLTNVFADAVSFAVKSTDPSYVGADVWGNEEALGIQQPTQPVRVLDKTEKRLVSEATENTEAVYETVVLQTGDTDEEWAAKEAKYQSDKAAFDVALETARQKVDRIAFAGQVPVNVTGAIAGQYIIPVNDNGAIKGEAVSNPTFEQYQQAVGKVIAIEQDGRARIIVKVA